jgi:membrane protein
MIGMVVLLLILSLVSTAILNIIQLIDSPLLKGFEIEQTAAWPALRLLLPSIVTFLMFTAAYRWIPNTNVRWRASIAGALWTAIAWELARNLFDIYLTSGLPNYEILYGSLGTVLALMLWIYISCVIILLGAHLTASIDFRYRLKLERQAAAASKITL